MKNRLGPPNLLRDSRVYLSGPMDFVGDREIEMKFGWRNRVGEFFRELDVTVFDPWFKPEVYGLHEYGREGQSTTTDRDKWTFDPSPVGSATRGDLAATYWPTMHIDLRMVDTADFLVAYAPTNIYSVGTPHEIILARQQRKPVLFVSPPVSFPALKALEDHLDVQKDAKGRDLLRKLAGEVPIKINEKGIPSLWYMPLIDSESFFDGFGFEPYRTKFGWSTELPLDQREKEHPPKRPLLPFLESLNNRLPQKWSRTLKKYVPNDDWLLWNLEKLEGKAGANLSAVHQSPQ